ncbi:MAG TPA: hypothetical protein VMZ05_12275, partial [Spirochaetota bacterium]|nr:hypothetical protein [Spirochaetota bacterium]
METVQTFVLALDPVLRYIILGVVGAGIVAWVVLFLIFRRRFISFLKKAFDEGTSVISKISGKKLCRKSSLIGRLLKANDPKRADELLLKTGISSVWISALQRSCKRSTFRKVLEYHIQDG